MTAGYCLFRDDGTHYYLRQLFVARSHRRAGFAAAQTDWIYANVWSRKPMRLDVFAHNEEAVTFYKAYG